MRRPSRTELQSALVPSCRDWRFEPIVWPAEGRLGVVVSSASTLELKAKRATSRVGARAPRMRDSGCAAVTGGASGHVPIMFRLSPLRYERRVVCHGFGDGLNTLHAHTNLVGQTDRLCEFVAARLLRIIENCSNGERDRAAVDAYKYERLGAHKWNASFNCTEN